MTSLCTRLTRLRTELFYSTRLFDFVEYMFRPLADFVGIQRGGGERYSPGTSEHVLIPGPVRSYHQPLAQDTIIQVAKDSSLPPRSNAGCGRCRRAKLLRTAYGGSAAHDWYQLLSLMGALVSDADAGAGWRVFVMRPSPDGA